jgi:hypothetical protein
MRAECCVALSMCVVLLTGCSSPAQKAQRALRQAQGWAAVAEAVTAPRFTGALPAHFIVRTCEAGVLAVDEQARTIDALQGLSQRQRPTASDALRQLAGVMRALGSAVGSGESAGAERAALLEAYAAVMARVRADKR